MSKFTKQAGRVLEYEEPHKSHDKYPAKKKKKKVAPTTQVMTSVLKT